MQPILQHRFAVELFSGTEPRKSLAQVPLNGDIWGPALEWARFAAIRAERRESLTTGEAETIEPVWHEKLGEPYVDGFKIVGSGRSGEPECLHHFDSDYFHASAKAAAQTLLKDGRLEAGQTYGFLPCAFADPGTHRASRPKFAVKSRAQPFGLRETDIEHFFAGACPQGTVLEEDFATFIPRHVLDETVYELDMAGAAETGGVFVGYLHRDPLRRNVIFAEVTAQIPVRHAVQELTSLTFTAESWASVDGALKLRNKGERKIGWWHSHPARRWCEKCPVENRATCPRSGDFFSEQDHALHATVFPAAFNVALVVSDSFAHGLTFPMFGWREGRIAQRGFHVTGGNGEPIQRIERNEVEEEDLDVPACSK